MNTEHDHRICKHKKIKYCAFCRVVYCTKCGQEWSEKSWTWTHPYNYSSVSDSSACEGHTDDD